MSSVSFTLCPISVMVSPFTVTNPILIYSSASLLLPTPLLAMNLFNRIRPSPVSCLGDSDTSVFFGLSSRGVKDFFSSDGNGFLKHLFLLSGFENFESRSVLALNGFSLSFLNLEKRSSPSFLFSNGFENFFSLPDESDRSNREEDFPYSRFENLLSPED